MEKILFFFTRWSTAKITIMSGVTMAVVGFSLLFTTATGLGFLLHLLGDMVIVFGVISCVFADDKK